MLQGLLAILLIIILLLLIAFMLLVRFAFQGAQKMRDFFGVLISRMVSPKDRDYTGRHTNQYSFSNRNRGGRAKNSNTGGGNARNDGFGGGNGTYSTTYTESGTTIIDHHAGERRQRKIFSEDEGEYVSFEEE